MLSDAKTDDLLRSLPLEVDSGVRRCPLVVVLLRKALPLWLDVELDILSTVLTLRISQSGLLGGSLRLMMSLMFVMDEEKLKPTFDNFSLSQIDLSFLGLASFPF